MYKYRLAVYDVMGIQDFVFSSNELQLNIGASRIVENILTVDLPELIQEHLGKYEVNWRQASEFRMLKDTDLEAEIIYIGGGNAMVAFKDKISEQKVTRALSRRIFQRSYSLSVAAASIETNFECYVKDREDLFKQLGRKKSAFRQSVPLFGISITKQESRTGLPVVFEKTINKKEHCSAETNLKWTSAQASDTLILNNPETFAFANEFDKLGRQKGEGKLAVVHIDGNNIGMHIEAALKNLSDYEKAVSTMRKISSTIKDCYTEALNDMLKSLETNILRIVREETIKEDGGGKINLHSENGKYILPFRKIISSGDDITFVCHAGLAIDLAEIFLTQVSKCYIDGFPHPLSACAGIAIVNWHFPFFRAYQLAEECCASAKATAKNSNDTRIRSWLDFQIVLSGFTENLSKTRSKFYHVPGMDKPSTGDTVERYNLLWRPYLIDNENGGGSSEDRTLSVLKLIIKGFKEKTENGDATYKAWPRSKVKELREAFLQGEDAVKLFLKEARARNLLLPSAKVFDTFDKDRGFCTNSITPYFDALEIMDLYLELVKEENESEN